MKNVFEIQKYIQRWLEGLKVGPVFQDRIALDDTTKIRNIRTYILFEFPDGMQDDGPWFSGYCVVCIGSRDKTRGTASRDALEEACKKFQAEFEKDGRKDCYDDRENGMSFIENDYVDDYATGLDEHEYKYVLEMIAEKD